MKNNRFIRGQRNASQNLFWIAKARSGLYNFQKSRSTSFFEYLKIRKKYWLIPIFLCLLILGSFIMLGQGAPVLAPYIYAVF